MNNDTENQASLFKNVSKGTTSQTIYHGKFHFLSYASRNGVIPGKYRNIIKTVLSKAISNKLSKLTVTFYIIDADADSLGKIYFALSGNHDDQTIQNIIANMNSIAWDGPKPDIVCIPCNNNTNFQLTDNEIFTNAVNNFDDIFARILQELTTRVHAQNNRNAERFNELSVKFQLLQQHIDALKVIADLMQGNVNYINIGQLHNEYKAFYEQLHKTICHTEQGNNIVRFAMDLFLPFNESSHVRFLAPTIDLHDQSYETYSSYRDAPVIQMHHFDDIKYYRHQCFKRFIDAFSLLRQKFSSININSIVHELSHCAEDNLIAFLRQNNNVLESPGEHYIFSAKKSENDYCVADFCNFCDLTFSKKFESVLQSYYQAKVQQNTASSASTAAPLISVAQGETQQGAHNNPRVVPPAASLTL